MRRVDEFDSDDLRTPMQHVGSTDCKRAVKLPQNRLGIALRIGRVDKLGLRQISLQRGYIVYLSRDFLRFPTSS